MLALNMQDLERGGFLVTNRAPVIWNAGQKQQCLWRNALSVWAPFQKRMDLPFQFELRRKDELPQVSMGVFGSGNLGGLFLPRDSDSGAALQKEACSGFGTSLESCGFTPECTGFGLCRSGHL